MRVIDSGVRPPTEGDFNRTFSQVLDEVAEEYRDRVAISFAGKRTISFGELDRDATRLANAFIGAGFLPGESVAVQLWNSPEYLLLYLALARAGLVIVPVNRRAATAELVTFASDAEARCLVVEGSSTEAIEAARSLPGLRLVVVLGELAPGFDAGDLTVVDLGGFMAGGSESRVQVEIDPGSTGAIHYTSGTTGVAKGVVRSHASNVALAACAIYAMPLTTEEAWMHTLPMHSVGTYCFALAPMLIGARIVFSARVDPKEVLPLAREEQVVMLHMIPTTWEMLFRTWGHEEAAVPDLRIALWGAMPLPRGTAERLERWLGTPLIGCYGASESPGSAYSTAEIYHSDRYDAAGTAVPGMELRIIDDDGDDVPAGTFGELLLRGPLVMTGYLNKPEMTAAALDEDGWYHSGDLGKLDADDVLTVTDRKKDMIISGGENIYPGEVENVISRMPGVVEVAVVGPADELWGQSVCAFVVPAEGQEPTEEEIVDRCREVLAGYKVPRTVKFVDSMPKSSLGKVEKHTLLERLADPARA